MEASEGKSAQHERRDLIQNFFENFDLKLFYYVIRKSLFFIFILLLLALLIPYLVIRYTTPIYETKATLIKKKEINNNLLDEKSTEFLKSNDEEKINRDIQVIKSDFLLDNIADSLQLNVQFFKQGRIPIKKSEVSGNDLIFFNHYQIFNNSLYGREIKIEIVGQNTYQLSYDIEGRTVILKNLNFDANYKTSDFLCNLHINKKNIQQGIYIVIFNNRETIKNYVLSNLNVINATPNIFFSIKSSNSAKSEFVISKVIKGFLQLDQKENSEKVENSISYIRNFIDTINLQLRKSQAEKANFVKSNSIFDPNSQLQSNLQEMESYKQRIDELDTKLFSIQKLKTELTTNSTGKFDINLITQDRELSQLISERNKMLIDYKSTHPTVAIVNKQINDRLNVLRNDLKFEVEDYNNRISLMKRRRGQAESTLSSLPEKNMEFNKLQKEVEIKEKYVIDLIEKQIQYLILKSSISSDYLVIQPPKTLGTLVSPKKSILYGTGISLFCILSFFLVLLRYLRFDKIVSLSEIKKNTSVPVLGYVPFVEEAHDEENAKKSSPESRIVVLANPKSRTAEVFKKMRASLKYTSHSDYKTICSTSTISGEGKTFVLINLAAVHALLDKKVVIIDLDLRKPRISKSFKMSNRLGMSNLLTDNALSIDECIQKYPTISNLDVITSGPIPPNPSELITSEKFDKILEELKLRYDYIFIDTPPVGLVNESVEIVNKVDVPLYLVRFNYSRKEFFNVLNETNRLNVKSSLFLVINHFGEGASNYVNYDYGGYSYGYGYSSDYHNKHEGYYTEVKSKKKVSLWSKLGKIFDWNL